MSVFRNSGWSRRLMGFGLTLGLTLLAGLMLVRSDIAQRREAFQAEARVAHRLLSQRMAQHEAILATLALQAPGDPNTAASLPLPPGFGQLVSAQREPAPASAAPPALRPQYRIDRVEETKETPGRYALAMEHQGAVFRLVVDSLRLLADEAWPWPAEGPVRVTLVMQGMPVVLQPGADHSSRPTGLTEGFRFEQALSSESQPFELHAQRWTGPAQWPWVRLLLAAAGSVLFIALLFKAQALRAERQNAAEFQRLAKVARLNTLGELAAGMAHELNQPLTAVLSGTQAALRLLRDAQTEQDAEGVAEAIPALELAAAQARRAADVVSRLRGLVKPPALGQPATAVDLADLARGLIQLLIPEFRRLGIGLELQGAAGPVRADRVAVEQILHNLLANALQALEQSSTAGRCVSVLLQQRGDWVDCVVQDTGPGIPPQDLAHIFEPFFSTRADGLGLGLSLCQTLAQALGGQLTVTPVVPHGARFCLSLPAFHQPST